MADLIRDHRTTLVFVNTRKMAERIAARLTRVLGEDAVTSHHGSLSRARRLDAEQRLKTGKLRALVATASLELGIDVGDVDLAIQVGSTRSIATFLQRVGRAGHALKKVPKGRVFPLTRRARGGRDPPRDQGIHRTAAPAPSTSSRNTPWLRASQSRGRGRPLRLVPPRVAIAISRAPISTPRSRFTRTGVTRSCIATG